jgi:uncharacterized protein DUF998
MATDTLNNQFSGNEAAAVTLPNCASVLQIPLLAARLAVAGAATCLVLLFILHVIKPELDPTWRMVSEYAIGPHGWVMAGSFLSQALGCAALFIAIRSQVRGFVGYLGLFFLLAAVVGLVMAAFFPSDPITISPQEATATGKMHGVAAMIGIPSLPVAAMLISFNLVRQPAWSRTRGPLLCSAVLALLSLVLMLVTIGILLPQHGGFGPEVVVGWPNRLLMLAYCGWVMTVGWQAARLA